MKLKLQTEWYFEMDVVFDRCVKFEKSNDQMQLIFGSLSVIQARDAVSLPVTSLLIVLLEC